MKLVSKILVAVLVLALALCAIPAVFAAADGSAPESPIVLTELPSAEITIPVGSTVWYKLPAGGKQLNVEAKSGMVSMVDENMMPIGTESAAFPGVTGDVIVGFTARRNDATIVLSLSDIVYGTENAPKAIGADEKFAYANLYILKVDLAAGNEDGYYWTFEVPAADDGKVLYLYASDCDVAYILDMSYSVDGENWSYPSIAEGNPITTYRLEAGTVVSIHIAADMDWDTWTIPALKTTLNLCVVDGNKDDAVGIYNEGAASFNAYVNGGTSITYSDPTQMSANWADKGVKITTKIMNDDWQMVPNMAAIANTVITVNGIEYKDTDGDGYIEFMMEANDLGNNQLSIKNANGENLKYIVEFVDEAGECQHDKVTFVKAVNAGVICHENGHAQYWVCDDCGTLFADEALTNKTTMEVLEIGYTWNKSNIKFVEGYAATCTANGLWDHYSCTCGELKFEDAKGTIALTDEEVIILTNGHSTNLEHTDAVKPTCTTAGNIEAWYCGACGKYLVKNPDGVNTPLDPTDDYEIVKQEEIRLAPTGHSTRLEHTEAVKPTCTTAGNIEAWYCAACGNYLVKNEAGAATPSDPTDDYEIVKQEEIRLAPTGHSTRLNHTEAVKPTCTTAGCIEFWVCDACGEYLIKNEAGAATPLDPTDDYEIVEKEEVKLAPTGHSTRLEHTEAVKPTCTTAGNIEAWYCAACGNYLVKNEAGAATPSDPTDDYEIVKQEEIRLAPTMHDTKSDYIEAKPATETEAGNIAYYLCGKCGAYFLKNEDGTTTELKFPEDIVIPATGNPKTGDMGLTLAAVVAMVSMGAVLVIGKKKED